MSRIYIQREHQLDRKTVRKRAEALARQLRDEYGGNYRWEGDTVHYSYAGGIDARLTLQDEDILVDVKLGVLMLMMKGALGREIERYLDEHLAPPGPDKPRRAAKTRKTGGGAGRAPAGRKSR